MIDLVFWRRRDETRLCCRRASHRASVWPCCLQRAMEELPPLLAYGGSVYSTTNYGAGSGAVKGGLQQIHSDLSAEDAAPLGRHASCAAVLDESAFLWRV